MLFFQHLTVEKNMNFSVVRLLIQGNTPSRQWSQHFTQACVAPKWPEHAWRGYSGITTVTSPSCDLIRDSHILLTRVPAG